MTILGTIVENSDSDNEEEYDRDTVGAPPRVLFGRTNPVTVRKVRLGNPRKRPTTPRQLDSHRTQHSGRTVSSPSSVADVSLHHDSASLFGIEESYSRASFSFHFFSCLCIDACR
jgi:hypothetical protein